MVVVEVASTKGGVNMKHMRLAQIRKARGFTQEKMAELLGYKDKSGYCQLENGQVSMTLEKATRICEILDVKIEDIFFAKSVEVTSTHPICELPKPNTACWKSPTSC